MISAYFETKALSYFQLLSSIVAGLVVSHRDLSHEMTLSHEGRRPEGDNVNRV